MVKVDYTTVGLETQTPPEYAAVEAMYDAHVRYMDCANRYTRGATRDGWITCADQIDEQIEAALVKHWHFTHEEIVDFWDMTRFNWSPSDSIERIMQARDERDARDTIGSLIFAMNGR